MVFLNDSNDLKSTASAGRSFHTFITLMLKKDVLIHHEANNRKYIQIQYTIKTENNLCKLNYSTITHRTWPLLSTVTIFSNILQPTKATACSPCTCHFLCDCTFLAHKLTDRSSHLTFFHVRDLYTYKPKRLGYRVLHEDPELLICQRRFKVSKYK